MRFFELLESSYTDVLRKEVVDFIEENKNYYSDYYVTFSNGDSPNKTGLGIHVIPLMYFVNKPMEYVDIINDNNIIVIDVSSDILFINKIERNQFNQLMKRLKIKDINKTFEDIMNKRKYNASNSYGHVLNHCLQYELKEGEVTDKKLSTQQYVDKIKQLGFTALVDTSTSINYSVLSSDHTSLGYVFDNAEVKIEEIIGKSEQKKPVVQDTDEIIHDLAMKIAEGLDTGLNHDDPYHQGLDHYYWTFDGVQIRITETFKKSDDNNDSRAYILDIITAYGILYHVTEAGDTHDKIMRDVKKRYSKMVEPLSDWKPADRDVFLINKSLDYKDYEAKIEDVIKEVKKYYKDMRDMGLRYKITLHPERHYSDFDLSFMSGIMDRFAQNASAKTFVNKISDNGEITDMRTLDDYFPRGRLPHRMDYEQLKRMAAIYDIAKKLQPKKSGWRVFHNNH